jgi:hypothetical protein
MAGVPFSLGMSKTISIFVLSAIGATIALLMAIPATRRWLVKRLRTFDYLWAYFVAFYSNFLDIVWGVAVVGVIFGLPLLIWSLATQFMSTIPAWVNWTAVGFAFFITGYYMWRADHVRLQPKLEVGKVTPQSWDHQLGKATAYYFFVLNRSSGTSVKGIEVRLVEIEPPVPNTHWIPAHLFQKNDNEPGPRKKTFDLHPGDEKAIDLVTGIEGNNVIEVRHIVDNVSRDIPAGNDYRFKVRITAENTLPVFVWFRVEMKPSGGLQCEMEPQEKEK